LRGKLGRKWQNHVQVPYLTVGGQSWVSARRKTQHPFAVVAQNKEMLRAAGRGNWSESVGDVHPSDSDIAKDIFAILEAFALHQVRRYFRHRFWEEESLEAEFSERAEPGLKLENVAAHSWHVADATLLFLDYFEWLDRERCLSLAILHDKLEMYTGDANPVGKDGKGSRTHAFDETARLAKSDKERRALIQYGSVLRISAAERQANLLSEMIEGASEEARFVKAMDKLQALAFVHMKKRGEMPDAHVRFTLRYSQKCYEYFPPLKGHYEFLRSLFLEQIGRRRNCTAAQLERDLLSQLELDFSACSSQDELD
jgi:5'-deoxynucleotidase YfbR-like HD superfamily hydrolase